MTRSRVVLIAACSLSAFAFAVACGGGDDNNGDNGGDASTPVDSGPGTDATVGGDSSPPVDSGTPDAGPFCNVTPCAIGLASGGVHNCALIADGTVRCWGGNLRGALGSGAVVDGGTVAPPISATPLAVAGESNVVRVAAGGFYIADLGFTCALHANKTVDCWGSDQLGTLGAGGDASTFANPTPQSTLLTNAIDVSAGLYAACAVLSSGDVACWGDNALAQVSPPATSAIYASPNVLNAGGTKFAEVSVGYLNACAVTNDGHLWCWGVPSTGAGGHITDGGVQDQLPAEVPGIDSVASVASGYETACALKTDGSIWCFGLNAIGMLGRVDGGSGAQPTPAPVDGVTGTKFTQITAHVAGFCALDTASQVWCWGYNQNGETGLGMIDGGSVVPVEVDVPTKVDGLSNVDQISVGGMAFHVCALIHGGAVKCWGSDAFDELGFAPPDGGLPYFPTPTTVTF